MRKLAFLAAASIAAMTFAGPAQAQLTQVGDPTEGNACTDGGGIDTCVATQTGVINGTSTDPLASALVARIENNDAGSVDVSSLYPTISGDEFSFDIVNGTLTFNYTPDADDPTLHYLGLFQGGAPAGGTPDFNNTYYLFYDANGITSATFDLSQLFDNVGLSHIDVYDEQVPNVPEPATWAMMLVGFGATGYAMRRTRRRKGLLEQIA